MPRKKLPQPLQLHQSATASGTEENQTSDVPGLTNSNNDSDITGAITPPAATNSNPGAIANKEGTASAKKYAKQGGQLVRLRLLLALQREDNKATQEEVARQSGISLPTLKSIERGIQVPSPETKKKLATVLGDAVMDIDWPIPANPPKHQHNRRFTEQGTQLMTMRLQLAAELGGNIYISQEKLGEMAGISAPMIKMLELGQQTPSESTKRKLATVFGDKIYTINWPPPHLKPSRTPTPTTPTTLAPAASPYQASSASAQTGATPLDPVTTDVAQLPPNRRLEQMRLALPASQEQVSRRLGISWLNYRKIEAFGKSILLFNDPTFNLKERFVQVFGEQVRPVLDELLELAGPVKAGPKPKK